MPKTMVDLCSQHDADVLLCVDCCQGVNYVAAAIKLYEAAFSRGYARAAYYLGEISDGHLR